MTFNPKNAGPACLRPFFNCDVTDFQVKMAESEPSNLLQRFKVVLLGEQSGGYCQFSIACYLLHYLSYGIMQYTAPESILQRQLHT